MEVAEIKAHAEWLRRGFELYRLEADPDFSFSRFPEQCCDFTTDICQLYFECFGLTDLWNVNAKVSSVQKHVWLEIGTVIVDITADQFQQPKVIVGTNSKWHRGLQVSERRIYDPEWQERISERGSFREVLERVLELASQSRLPSS